jgi:hypothetical protein
MFGGPSEGKVNEVVMRVPRRTRYSTSNRTKDATRHARFSAFIGPTHKCSTSNFYVCGAKRAFRRSELRKRELAESDIRIELSTALHAVELQFARS